MPREPPTAARLNFDAKLNVFFLRSYSRHRLRMIASHSTRARSQITTAVDRPSDGQIASSSRKANNTAPMPHPRPMLAAA